MWKKLIDQALKENGADVEQRLLLVWNRLGASELPTVFSYRTKELYGKYAIFKANEEWGANLILILSGIDDLMTEISLSKGLLSLLEKELKRHTVDRSTVVQILKNLLCTREIYLEMVLSHSVVKQIKSQLGKKRVTGNGILLAIACIKACRIASLSQISKMFLVMM